MKVRDMRSDRRVKFKDLPVGTVINLETGLWIKVEPFILADQVDHKLARVIPWNMIRLEDGLAATAYGDDIMSPVNLEIEIHDYNPKSEDKR